MRIDRKISAKARTAAEAICVRCAAEPLPT
jgi:hypothetical protein